MSIGWFTLLGSLASFTYFNKRLLTPNATYTLISQNVNSLDDCVGVFEEYVIPKEGSNKFVGGFVIVKNTKHKDASEKFINFMCRSNIAVRNMTSTGYTSPIKGAWDEFGNNKIMFPSKEELSRCEAFLYDSNSTEKYNKIWKEVR